MEARASDVFPPVSGSLPIDLQRTLDELMAHNERGLWLDGWRRQAINRRLGRRDLAVGDIGWRESIMSAAAEHYFCNVVGVPFAFDWQRPGKWDFVLPDGRTGDVKWRERTGGDLIRSLTASSFCDLYVLVEGRYPDTLTAVGWASSDEMFARQKMLRCLTYVVDRRHLRPISDLLSRRYCYEERTGQGVLW